MQVLTWNLEWARRSAPRGKRALGIIEAIDPDVQVLTEVHLDALPDDGDSIWADADYGYGAPANRRKVGLWSRWGWTDIDRLGVAAMPGGRYAAATTPSPMGPVRVIGVCIPWRMAHVSTGRRDRAPWEDHLAYLEGLGELVRGLDTANVVVAGDFNQRFTGRKAPAGVHEPLLDALGALTVATTEVPEGLDRAPIDHVAHGPGLVVTAVRGIPREDTIGRISDHDGVTVGLAASPTPEAGRMSSPG